LYANYCAACHGDKGDGNGPAARFLYAKPRDFGEAKFRLVTTGNRRPSDDDLLGVVSRGMPGSAMFPFAHLGEDDRRLLVGQVRRLTLAGMVEREKPKLKPGETVEELTQDLADVLQPGKPVAVPDDLPSPGPESVARGAQLYRSQGCVACHGETGKGDGVQDQRDDNGMPTRPRDFTRGIFKSGRAPKQLYVRTVLGMPGTPMPGSSNLRPEQIGDLVNFILSLSDPGAQAQVEHRRTRLVARRSPGTLSE